MPKIRLTKNELKKNKDALKRFYRYLPMLQLKKKQLQLEIIKIYQVIQAEAAATDKLRREITLWVDVFAEDVFIEDFISLKSINIDEGNIAGVDIPVFSGIDFTQKDYDFMVMPLWVDRAIESVKQMLTQKAKLSVLHRQLDILKEELRIATQRVNLFEKIKIPEAKENSRVIQIFLGELQTAEVVRGKIAKAKIERRKQTVEI
ncbi:MAG TPA: V-type ATP synthase subunit D [Candidatus Omnitrophica bacterium]|nr:V-type ATP synthase subunit D [Candidatus Omnitrophota bacterium]